MSDIIITLKDGSTMEFPQGITVGQVAEKISRRLANEAIVGKFNGTMVDLETPLQENGRLEIYTFEDAEGKSCLRHSVAHIMAEAVQNLFPDTKLGIGPAIEDGFYYDFDSPHKFSPEDIEKIEKEMERIIKADLIFKKSILSKGDAIDFFNKREENYKIQLIEDLPQDTEISIYEQGDWADLCAGPHISNTGKVKAFKLLSLAGAYWKGSEQNKMLQRIYGTVFPKKKMLDDYLEMLEEAKKRDHRILGAQLGLFSLQEEGPGFPLFHPKGMILRNKLEEFWRREHVKWGYQEIKTPIILNKVLWEQSGHWEHYRENMYFTNIDENDFCIKPMNCPGAMLVYKSEQHSYREFPIRLAEMGLVHRHEKSGVLHGLMRVRAFTQDDAHIFMLPSQITEEIKKVIDLVDYFYKVFGFEYEVELSTKPEKAMGEDDVWEKAIEALKNALVEKEISYKINDGDGAFYGPKIDFHLKDSIGRMWQCGTIQLDFLMPEKFDLYYIGEDGQKHRPVVIHRVVLGSIERFIGILIEHFAGAFPVWLAPVQAKVLQISENQNEYGIKVVEKLRKLGLRVELDARNEKIGYKIREAQLQKIPYMLIVGDKEMENEKVAVRKRVVGDLGTQDLSEVAAQLVADAKMPEKIFED